MRRDLRRLNNEIACDSTWSVMPERAIKIGTTGLCTVGTVAGFYPGAVVATVERVTGTAEVAIEAFEVHVFLPLVTRETASQRQPNREGGKAPYGV